MSIIKTLTQITLILLIAAGVPLRALATELIIVEQPDCPYCELFNAEIATIYAKTTEGQQAPLVRLQLNEIWPKQYSEIAEARFTPTFILVHDGIEVDRLLGYQGDEFFWFLLGEMLDKIPQ